MWFHVAAPSVDRQTPSSEPRYSTAGSDGSTMMTFSGRSSGGLTLDQVGDSASAFVVLNTWPLRRAASKLPYAAYRVFGFPGSKARLLTVRSGRFGALIIVQLVPPLVVTQILPSLPKPWEPNA